MRVLLVEDDLPLSHALRTALERHGLVIDAVHDLATADSALRLGVHDALLLDRGLPDGDGVDFIAAARVIAPALSIFAGRMFIEGEPRNLATKRLSGEL